MSRQLTVACRDDALTVTLPAAWPCLSSATLNGGLSRVRTWMNLQVPPAYARTDPAAHLAVEAALRGLASPVVGMLTAAAVADYQRAHVGSATVIATVGLGHPIAAAPTRATSAPSPAAGTINLLAVTTEPLTPSGLVDAVATCVAARAQTLAEAGVRAHNADGPATGTATDSLCVATPAVAGAAFAGPATAVGTHLARAVRAALLTALAAARHQPAHPTPAVHGRPAGC